MIINKTPHDIVVFVRDKKIIIKSEGEPIRLKSTTVRDGFVSYGNDLIPLTKSDFSEVENMPDKREGVFYIVSSLVCQAYPDRDDLLIPNESVRDENGNIIGCKSLSVNPFSVKRCGCGNKAITTYDNRHFCSRCWLDFTGDGDL